MPMTYDEMKFGEQKRKRAGQYHECENCHRRFYLSLSMSQDQRRGRFCGRRCQKEFHAINKICPICGKEFTVPRGIADRYTVCSWKCRAHLVREETCEQCGKTFITHETRWKPRFCSFSCYRRSNGENNLEKLVRVTLEEMKLEFIQEKKIGRYAIDFYFPGYLIALEIDGAYWHQNKERDERKNTYLANHGIKVIRITDNEIESIGARNAIYKHCSNHLNLLA